MKTYYPSTKFLLTFAAVIQFSLNVQAGSWDVANPSSMLPSGVALFGGGVEGFYVLDQKIVANNGVVYVIGYDSSSNSPAVLSWSQCNGWQELAIFQNQVDSFGFQGVNAIVMHGNNVYVGGLFDTVYPIGGSPVSANNVAVLDTQSGIWSHIGTTFSTSLSDSNRYPLCSNIVTCMTVDNATNVYVALWAGEYDMRPGQVSPVVQTLPFGQNTWQPLGAGLIGSDFSGTDCWLPGQDSGPTVAMDTDGTNVFVAGQFDGGQTTVGGSQTISPSIIKWNRTSQTWQAMGVGIFPPSFNNQGIYGICSMAVAGNNVFVCGDYRMEHHDSSGDCVYDTAPLAGTNVSRFSTSGTYLGTAGLTIDGGQWENIGATALHSHGVCVRAQGKNVFLLGNFDHVGNVAATNIAEWFLGGNIWSALGTGIQPTGIEVGTANYLAPDANAVYVFGPDIYQAGGMQVANNICRWVESSYPENVTLTSNGIYGVTWTYCGTNPTQWLVEECSIPNPTSWLGTGFVDAEAPGSYRWSDISTGGMYVRVIGGYWDGSEYIETGPTSNVIFWNN